MNVGQVIACTKEWVELYGRHTPGFCGAHLMGGITMLPKDAPFPAYRDVDLNMVLHGLPERDIRDLAYNGLIMECGLFSRAEYRSPADVLARPPDVLGQAPQLWDIYAAEKPATPTVTIGTPRQEYKGGSQVT